MAKKKEVVEETPVDLSQYRQIHKETSAASSSTLLDSIKNLSKRTIALIVLAVVVVIACIFALTNNKSSKTSYTSSLSDGNTTLVTGDVTITKQGFYEYLLKAYGADEVLNQAYNAIADKEITDEKDIDAAVKDYENDIKSYMGSLKSYADTMGYSSVKDLRNTYIIPEAKKGLLQKKYLTDNFTTVCSTYQVTYLKQITYEKESQALKAIKNSTDKTAFNKIYKEKSGSDLGMVTSKTTSLDENITAILGDLSAITEDGVYSEAVKLSDETYAVFYVYNTDKEKNQDAIIETLANNSDVQEDIEAAYLKQYNFTVNDKKIKEEIKKNHSSFIN